MPASRGWSPIYCTYCACWAAWPPCCCRLPGTARARPTVPPRRRARPWCCRWTGSSGRPAPTTWRAAWPAPPRSMRWSCCASTPRADWMRRCARSSAPSWPRPCRCWPMWRRAAPGRPARGPTSCTQAMWRPWRRPPTWARPPRCRWAAASRHRTTRQSPTRRTPRRRPMAASRPRRAMPPNTRPSTTRWPISARWPICAAATPTGPSRRCARRRLCRPARRWRAM